MRADRLLSILLLLQTRGRTTAAALAERLEVSQRTIYRDLDALSAAGVPVYAERGAQGGCLLRPGYHTDLTGLNAAEVASLFAGTAGKHADALAGGRLQSALAKLEATLPEDRRSEAARTRERIVVDAQPWFEPTSSNEQLEDLRRAVMEERALRLTYSRSDGRRVQRISHPLGLVVKGGIWYLVASTGGQTRVYRCSRLHRVVVLKTRFSRPARFDLAAFWAQSSRSFVEKIPQYHFKLAVPRHAIPILPRIFGERMRAALDAAGPPTKRGLVVDFYFDSLEGARDAILGVGTLVEIVEPEELREAVHDAAERIAKMYAHRPVPGPMSHVPGRDSGRHGTWDMGPGTARPKRAR